MNAVSVGKPRIRCSIVLAWRILDHGLLDIIQYYTIYILIDFLLLCEACSYRCILPEVLFLLDGSLNIVKRNSYHI